ncbi:MAG: nicotinamide-nucleotide amidohydrolase family protein [Nitrospirae bacterium]|nr:nicotinamide-nucleotide amidohydrolase family protein [Candidatus Troglogloeales bacterium]MBI3598359.1 nicotinamide-nucleotide amidohydrolase family protein [Candidatus Troglogloeales bacterium]
MALRGEIIFLGIPSDIQWEAAPYLKALYSVGILAVAFTPIATTTSFEEGAREIEETITAATKRASVVCVMSTRGKGWQAREELLRKLLYRVSRKHLVLQAQGGLLPDGTSQFFDLDQIPLFILPFSATVLIMTPGTSATVYSLQSEIKGAIARSCEGRWIRMSSIAPAEITEWIKQESYYSSIRFKIIPNVADLSLLIASDKPSSLLEAVSGIRKRFGKVCYSFDGESIEEVVGDALLAKGQSLAIAESCTGGAIAVRLTRIPGASRYFTGAAVPYSNQLKEAIVSVPHFLIHKKGAVSSEVAARMAHEIRKSASSDIGLSVTGIAGPTGASREKPVGLVYVALSTSAKSTVTRHRFYGGRDEIREQASQIALETVLDYLGRKSV